MDADDDRGAVVVLAEDLGETGARDVLDVEEVAQDAAGADAGELVDVADDEQVAAVADGGEEAAGQGEVEHRCLVDDHEIRALQDADVVEEGVAVGRPDQPVHGHRRLAAGLFQAFGGFPGRGGQGDDRSGLVGDLHQVRRVWVLPQPGPPVRTDRGRVRAVRIAWCCSSVSPAVSWPVSAATCSVHGARPASGEVDPISRRTWRASCVSSRCRCGSMAISMSATVSVPSSTGSGSVSVTTSP
jgi:hypothetical protein